MSKYIIIAVLLLGGWAGYGVATAEPGDFFYQAKVWFGQVSYTAEVADEIALLEADLADIDAKVSAGTLTDDEAYELKTKIASRVANITASINASKNRELTENEKVSIATSLGRLKDALEKYRDSLGTLETKAKQSKRHTGGGGSKSIIEVVEDSINGLEDYIEEIDEEYVSDDSEENTEGSVVEGETEVDVETESETEVDTSTSTESDTSTTTEEDTSTTTDLEIESEGEVTL